MDQFLGQILMVAFNFAPNGWALCNGQTLSIAQNAALFSLLGTQFGGDGISTFNLPNLQSRIPIHQGQGQGLSSYTMGQAAGTENTSILISNLPAHNHPAACSNTAGPNTDPTGSYWSQANGGGRTPVATPAYAASANGAMAPNAIGLTGNSQPVNNIQPYLCVNFIIALTGIFPSRN